MASYIVDHLFCLTEEVHITRYNWTVLLREECIVVVSYIVDHCCLRSDRRSYLYCCG